MKKNSMSRAKRLSKEVYRVISDWAIITVRITVLRKLCESYLETVDMCYSTKLKKMGVNPDSKQVIDYKNKMIDLRMEDIEHWKKYPSVNELDASRREYLLGDITIEEWKKVISLLH